MLPRFSRRLDWGVVPNRLAEQVEKKRAAGARILDLTESNPTRAGIDYDGEAIRRALVDDRTLIYEPQPAGLERAREAVVGYYAARGLTVDPHRVLLTAGTSEAYAFLFKLLADAGEEILAPRPSYPLFEFLAGLEGLGVRQYRLGYDHGWWVDIESARAASDERTRAIVVVNPNNPTGNFLKARELEELVRLCAERGLALIADEVFFDYPFGEDPARAPSAVMVDEVLCFALNGLSKAAGLPQMKLGWMVVGGPRELREKVLARLELIADTYLSVGTPVQHAAAALLEGARDFQLRLRARLVGNLTWLRAALTGRQARVLEVEGGWYAILRLPQTRSEEEWALELLEKDSVLVQPGYFYDFEGEAFAVVSLLTQPEVFREGLGRILGK